MGVNTAEIDIRRWQCKAQISTQGWKNQHVSNQQTRYLSPSMTRSQRIQSIYDQD